MMNIIGCGFLINLRPAGFPQLGILGLSSLRRYVMSESNHDVAFHVNGVNRVSDVADPSDHDGMWWRSDQLDWRLFLSTRNDSPISYKGGRRQQTT